MRIRPTCFREQGDEILPDTSIALAESDIIRYILFVHKNTLPHAGQRGAEAMTNAQVTGDRLSPRKRTEPRRGRDAESARRAILAAAEEAFATSGFDGARVDAIAEASGYNKALLFHYF